MACYIFLKKKIHSIFSYAASMERKPSNIIVVHFAIFCFILDQRRKTIGKSLHEIHFAS